MQVEVRHTQAVAHRIHTRVEAHHTQAEAHYIHRPAEDSRMLVGSQVEGIQVARRNQAEDSLCLGSCSCPSSGTHGSCFGPSYCCCCRNLDDRPCCLCHHPC